MLPGWSRQASPWKRNQVSDPALISSLSTMGLQVNTLKNRGWTPTSVSSPGSAEAYHVNQKTPAKGQGLTLGAADSGLSMKNRILESVLAGLERDELSLPDAFQAWHTQAVPEDPFKEYRGRHVEIDHGDEWVWGTIQSMNADGSFRICYEDDGTMENVGRHRIKNLFGTDVHDGCHNCPVLSEHILALTQSLAGMAGAVFNWSVGLTKIKRGRLAKLLVDYLKPCVLIHSSLDLLCFELEHVQLSEHERPSKYVQTMWQDHVEDDYSREEEQPYLLDNSILQTSARGIGFRKSPNMADMATRDIAKWGDIHYGTRINPDWIEVDERFYLPVKIKGVPVVVLQEGYMYGDNVTDAELSQTFETVQAFQKMDVDGDGVVTAEEFVTGMKRAAQEEKLAQQKAPFMFNGVFDLDIWIFRATGLQVEEKEADIFCTCEVSNQPELPLVMSGLVEGSANPEWNYRRRIRGYTPGNDGDHLLEFEVDDFYSKDQGSLARGALAPGDFLPSGIEGTIPLEDTAPGALLHIKVDVWDAADDPKGLEDMEDTRGEEIREATALAKVKKLGLTPSEWPPGEVYAGECMEWAKKAGIDKGSKIITLNDKVVKFLEREEFVAEMQARPLRIRFLNPPPEAVQPDKKAAKKGPVDLDITIMGASGFAGRPDIEAAEPYVLGEVPGLPSLTKVRTGSEEENEPNPEWNFRSIITGYVSGASGENALMFTVLDINGSDNQVLARAVVKPSSFLPNGYEGVVPLRGIAGAQLEVNISVAKLGVRQKKLGKAKAAGQSKPALTTQTSTVSVKDGKANAAEQGTTEATVAGQSKTAAVQGGTGNSPTLKKAATQGGVGMSAMAGDSAPGSQPLALKKAATQGGLGMSAMTGVAALSSQSSGGRRRQSSQSSSSSLNNPAAQGASGSSPSTVQSSGTPLKKAGTGLGMSAMSGVSSLAIQSSRTEPAGKKPAVTFAENARDESPGTAGRDPETPGVRKLRSVARVPLGQGASFGADSG